MHFNAHPANDAMEPLNNFMAKKKKKCYYRKVLTLGIITAKGKKTIVAFRLSAFLLSSEDLAQGSKAVY